MKHLTELARSLCELRGISGDEARVREFIAGELQDGSTRLSMKTDRRKGLASSRLFGAGRRPQIRGAGD